MAAKFYVHKSLTTNCGVGCNAHRSNKKRRLILNNTDLQKEENLSRKYGRAEKIIVENRSNYLSNLYFKNLYI